MVHREFVYYNVQLAILQITVQENVCRIAQMILIILHIGKAGLVYQCAHKLRLPITMLTMIQGHVYKYVLMAHSEIPY